MKYVLWIMTAALCCPTCRAQPLITDLQPRGVQKGRPFKLTLIGRDLGEGARIQSTLPATFTPLGTEKGVMGGASFLVEPMGEPAVGVYSVRVITPIGISNIQLFSIGSFPEYTEDESRSGALPNSNDTIESAQPLPSGPLTLNGKLSGPERDVYRITAKAREKRVIEVEARRCGSAIDPVIELQDPSGKVLARSEDAALIGLDARLEFDISARRLLLRRRSRCALLHADCEFLSAEDRILQLPAGSISARRDGAVRPCRYRWARRQLRPTFAPLPRTYARSSSIFRTAQRFRCRSPSERLRR